MSHSTPERHILLVGSWAKEEITLENLQRNPQNRLFVYMDCRNPGILERVNDFRIGDFQDKKSIAEFAKKCEADLVLITTAEPLLAGVTDFLLEKKLRVFGPTREAARLETDKAFTRNLMKKYLPFAVPRFRICQDSQEALEFCKILNWEVAVKPVGLTDGLGVKVAGIQLHGEDAISEYIHQIHENKISGDSRIIIEEKLEGEEFTIQCFTAGGHFHATPAVQDFKKRENGDQGPNTASMGSYASGHFLLPFMKEEDYQQAVSIIRHTLDGFHKETGGVCTGILYGQFMLSVKGVKLIEYNFRPGDPEWMNTVAVLENDIGDVIFDLLENRQVALKFRPLATVVKYIVPPLYPQKLNQTLDVDFAPADMIKHGVKIYCSYGLDEQGQRNVGSERGIAFLAEDGSITGACEKIEKALNKVTGEFHHRSDIGSKALLEKKTQNVQSLRNTMVHIRCARENDFMNVYNFISGCHPLENYSEHFYKIMIRYFGDSCFILESQGEIHGFILGFFSQTQTLKTYFLWQIGIHPDAQGKGYGQRLLQHAEDTLLKMGCRRIELTIAPENKPSQRLFEKMGYANISKEVGKTIQIDGKHAVKDYYRPSGHFHVYEKILPPIYAKN